MYELGLFARKNMVFVSSVDIARIFEKDHKHVLRDVESILSKTADDKKDRPKFGPISVADFGKTNFVPAKYKDAYGRDQSCCHLTRDGVTLLTMGYGGEKAIAFKIAYIQQFNAMESFIREKLSAEWKEMRLLGKKTRLKETDVIHDRLIPLAIEQGSKNAGRLYETYSKLVNSVLGIKAGERDGLSYEYVRAVEFLEHAIEGVVSAECDKGTDYHEIYQIAKAKCLIARDLCFLPPLPRISD